MMSWCSNEACVTSLVPRNSNSAQGRAPFVVGLVMGGVRGIQPTHGRSRTGTLHIWRAGCQMGRHARTSATRALASSSSGVDSRSASADRSTAAAREASMHASAWKGEARSFGARAPRGHAGM